MTNDDKNEIRQLITDLLTVNHAKTEAALDVLHYKMDTQENILGEIRQQVLKTNGRVTTAEGKIIALENENKNAEINHGVKCPHQADLNKKIRVIEDTMLSTKAVKVWIIGSVGISSLVVGILFIVFKIVTGI